MGGPTKKLGLIGSSVLTFIGYKQTNKNRQTDKQNIYTVKFDDIFFNLLFKKKNLNFLFRWRRSLNLFGGEAGSGIVLIVEIWITVAELNAMYVKQCDLPTQDQCLRWFQCPPDSMVQLVLCMEEWGPEWVEWWAVEVEEDKIDPRVGCHDGHGVQGLLNLVLGTGNVHVATISISPTGIFTPSFNQRT